MKPFEADPRKIRDPFFFTDFQFSVGQVVICDLLALRPDHTVSAFRLHFSRALAASLVGYVRSQLEKRVATHGPIDTDGPQPRPLSGVALGSTDEMGANAVWVVHTKDEFFFDIRLDVVINTVGTQTLDRMIAATVIAEAARFAHALEVSLGTNSLSPRA